MENKKVKSTSINLSTIVFIVFLVMKLGRIGEVANWSWWWVTAPLWLPITIVLALMLLFGLIAVIVAIFSDN